MCEQKVYINYHPIFVLFLIIFAFVINFRSVIFRQAESLLNNYSISLQSQVDGKYLQWQNKDSLESILDELQIFKAGVRDLKNYEVQPIKSVRVIYTPIEQTGLAFVTPQKEVISGGSYTVNDGVLTINIYVNEELAPEGDVEASFNAQLIQHLVALSTSTPSGRGEQTTSLEDRVKYFQQIMQDNFGDNEELPIKII